MGERFQLTVTPSDTIGGIKRKVEQMDGTSVAVQRLVTPGVDDKPLDDLTTMEELDIQTASTLNLIVIESNT